MAKYENIRALAKKQLQAVTESSDRWKAFLRTAAIAYNYSFPNQLLIHEQSPTATAVADIAYWNNNAGRWVKRGAHGIAVFDTRANSSRLRYLFDISDTIPRAEIPEALPWVITDQNWRPVWDKIVADNHADSIQSALLMLSTSCVAQRSAMFTTALGKAIDGSSLQWAKPDEQRQLFLQLITQSCLYMAALRCGVDTARLDLPALESVNQFDTNRIALCLGSACQQAARPLMQQIGSITREIDSVARAEKVRYYGDKQEETNNTKEVNNGVHDGERLPNPGADVERAADAGNRQWQPAAEIPAGERADGVRRDAVGGNAVPASGGDGQRSTPANRGIFGSKSKLLHLLLHGCSLDGNHQTPLLNKVGNLCGNSIPCQINLRCFGKIVTLPKFKVHIMPDKTRGMVIHEQICINLLVTVLAKGAALGKVGMLIEIFQNSRIVGTAGGVLRQQA